MTARTDSDQHDDHSALRVRPAFPRSERVGLTFRDFRYSDLPFLEKLYASTRWQELGALGWTDEAKTAFLQQQFQAQHSHYQQHYPDAFWWIIEHEGAPAGRLYLEIWPSEYRIIDVALMGDKRGLGLGSAVLRDVMGAAAKDGKPVGIHVEKNNPAMTLYRRLGYASEAEKGVYDLLYWRPVKAGQLKTDS